MGDTEISWTHRPGTVGRTWNPVQGCQRVSEGCRNCYAERLAARFAETGWSQGLINLKTRKWNGESRLAAHKLTEPLRWRQPATVFVNSMSDLFYERFTNEEIAAVFGVMAAAPQHTFQILTKRAKRMREWFEWMINALPLTDSTHEPRPHACWDFARKFIKQTGAAIESSVWNTEFLDRAHLIPWPLPNVWLGVSVENQDAADERIPELLRTPAAIRFLSCEPLIAPVDLRRWIGRSDFCCGCEAENDPQVDDVCPICGERGTLISTWGESQRETYLAGDRYADPFRDGCELSWLIAGCESGPGARTCDVVWLRSLRDQCAAAGVPYFLKQAVGTVHDSHESRGLGAVEADAGSKRKAGGVIELPYLDGVQHAEFPTVSR